MAAGTEGGASNAVTIATTKAILQLFSSPVPPPPAAPSSTYYGAGHGNITDSTSVAQEKPSIPFPDVAPLVKFKMTARVNKRGETLAPLQEWEGYVDKVENRTLCAYLVDLTAGSIRAREYAEIPLEEISENDLLGRVAFFAGP